MWARTICYLLCIIVNVIMAVINSYYQNHILMILNIVVAVLWTAVLTMHIMSEE